MAICEEPQLMQMIAAVI